MDVGTELASTGMHVESLEMAIRKDRMRITTLSAELQFVKHEVDRLETELHHLTVTTFVQIQDIEYCRGGEVTLLLDMYLPDEQILGTPMPVVIGVHGGGWRQGSKRPSSIDWLAQFGFLVVSGDYRLSDVARFPAAVQDLKCEVRWIRANANRYGADPERIGIWGSSSGGHLDV